MLVPTRTLPWLAALTLLAACAPLPPTVPITALAPAPLAAIDAAIGRFIAAEQMPGAQFWLERDGLSYHRAYGARALLPAVEALDEDTVFDAASLTKVVVTATAVQLLRERGRLDMEAPLRRYLPECGGPVGALSLRQLLTHTSGLPAGLPRRQADGSAWAGRAAALQLACVQALDAPPGTQFRYSDINFILLGELVARVGGAPLEQFARTQIFAPLGMLDSGYLPLQRIASARIAPTQQLGAAEGGRMLRGEVHDPTARLMGGVAGHAGLFSSSADLARFARMMVNGGRVEGRQFLSPQSMALLTESQSPPALEVRRSLGWDIVSPYARPRGKLYSAGSYGHTGFTGCILWIDPTSRSFYVLLANRVHPGRPTNILPLYEQLGTWSARAVGVAEPAAALRPD